MRSMQAEAFGVLMNVLFRMINAPTGSGKSAEICFLAARELHDNPKRKVVIVVPQTIIAKGFGDARLAYADGRELAWHVSRDLCNGNMRNKVAKIIEFLQGKQPAAERVLLCSHTSFAQAYHKLTDRRKAFRNVTVWIDEAHHVLGAERYSPDVAVVCNRLGDMVKFIMYMDPRAGARIGLSTAFFFRGDRASIIPQRYIDRFTR